MSKYGSPYDKVLPHYQRKRAGGEGRQYPPFHFKDQVFLLDYPGAPVEELAAVFHTLPEVPSASFQYKALMLPSDRMKREPGEAVWVGIFLPTPIVGE